MRGETRAKVKARGIYRKEFLKRRDEGKCFRCGGQFSPSHRCPKRSLRVVILGEDEEEEPDDPMVELDKKQMELFAFSAGGLTQPRTMKLHGQIGEKQLLILIDSGASHNFIGKDLVEALGLPKVLLGEFGRWTENENQGAL